MYKIIIIYFKILKLQIRNCQKKKKKKKKKRKKDKDHFLKFKKLD